MPKVLIIDDLEEIHSSIRSVLNSKINNKDDLNTGLDEILSNATDKKKEEPHIVEEPIQVFSAYQGEEGFNMYQKALEENDPFDLVICDMRMPPGWNGKKTLDEISSIDKKIVVLISTAFSDHDLDEIIENSELENKPKLLEKPFHVDDMEEMIKTYAKIGKHKRRKGISINK